MKLIIRTFQFFATLGYQLARFLLFKQQTTTVTGSKMLTSGEAHYFLSSRNTGLLLDGQNKRLSLQESYQNLCLSARVGAGKTTRYIVPNVLERGRQQCSMAIHDPKGEVRDLTSGYLKANGYKIIVLDVENIQSSHFFNPCLETHSEVEIEQIAETLIWCGNSGDKDPYWNNGATRILSVLLKCLSFGEEKYYNLPNLHHLLQNFGKMGENLDHWISHHCWNPDCPDDPYILEEWKGALTGNEEAIQSFVGVCLTALKSLSNRDLRAFLSKSDYRLSDFRQEKTAIFLITPSNKQQYYSFVVSLFFRSLFNECMRPEHLQGQSLPVYLFYDEFGNSYIPDFMSVANTIRGYRVSLSIILQSISQLGFRYGKIAAESIQGAMNTNVCLSGSDPVTAAYFSNLCGKVRERQRRNTTSLLDQNTDYREYNLMNDDEVRTMQDNQTLVVCKNRNPVLLPIKPYYEVWKFKKASQFPRYAIRRKKQPTVELVTL
jgi:type IV secretory pathway TraG/TraD family ATPase VirD4